MAKRAPAKGLVSGGGDTHVSDWQCDSYAVRYLHFPLQRSNYAMRFLLIPKHLRPTGNHGC